MSTVPRTATHRRRADAPLARPRRRDVGGGQHATTAVFRPTTPGGLPRPTEASTGRDEISQAIDACADALLSVAAVADLKRVGASDHPRGTAEEAMAFAGFLLELARPLDAMLHRVLIAGADSFNLLSERERCDARTIVSEYAMEDWAGRFVTFAEVEAGDEDAALPDARFFSGRYAQRIATNAATRRTA